MMVGCAIFVGILAGGGGIVTTDLTANVSDSATYLPVLNTTDFLSADYVVIDSEKISYTNVNGTAFLNCERGYRGTTAASHLSGARVYTEFSSTINYAVGFNLVAVQDNLGWASIVAIPVMFFVRTVPHVIKMSTNLLQGELAIISWFLYLMAAGFVVQMKLVSA